MRDLARLAIAAFGRQGEGSGVVGVDVQRIRRTLELSAGTQPQRRADGAAELPPIDRDQLNRFERHLRRELERDLIERTETLPPPGRWPSSTGRCRPARRRTWPPSTAPSRR